MICQIQSWQPRRSPQGEGGQAGADSNDLCLHSTKLGTPRAVLRWCHGDLRSRLQKHNAGEVPHTAKYAPWKVKTYIAFSNKTQAVEFEKYLKSASGRAFAKKRF
jgi:hypothetical protein